MDDAVKSQSLTA